MVQARTSLWYLVFFGFAVNYMIRINLNITIVDMIKKSSKQHNANMKKISNDCKKESSTLVKIETSTSTSQFSLNSNYYKNNNRNSNLQSLNSILSINKIIVDDDHRNSNFIYKNRSNNNDNDNDLIISNHHNRNSTEIDDDNDSDYNDYGNQNIYGNETTRIIRRNSNSSSINVSTSSFVYPVSKNRTSKELKDLLQNKIQTPEKIILDYFDINYEKNGFNWNEYEQGLVLGGFFWLHWVTQIPGGILARKYGTKLIYGLANAIGCWICFLLPIVSYLDYRLLIFFRVIQGLICGLAWPAMHHMTAQWIPPNERSKFVTAYLGSSIGIAIFYPLFGYIMSWTSWEWVYYICGIIGTIWYIAWLLMVFNTPGQHPRISDKERKYIEKSLGLEITTTTTKSNLLSSSASSTCKTPWKKILTSKPVWMNVIAQWGGIWGLFTLMTQAPTYFKTIHGWNIQMTGILSGLPHLMRMIFAYFFSIFGDYLLKTNKMSRTNVRKIATTMCCIVKGIFVLALAYSGCNSLAAIIFLTLATAVHGAVSTGPLASIVDIAPNYAGIILGISGMIGVLPGFISPVIVGILTYENQTINSWKYVFLITSVKLIVCGILYVIACESNLQDWNNTNNENDKNHEIDVLKDEKEMKLLSSQAQAPILVMVNMKSDENLNKQHEENKNLI